MCLCSSNFLWLELGLEQTLVSIKKCPPLLLEQQGSHLSLFFSACNLGKRGASFQFVAHLKDSNVLWIGIHPVPAR